MIRTVVFLLISVLGAGVARAACNPAFKPTGLIGDRYALLSAQGANFGCPITAPGTPAGPGVIQFFEHGVIAWSPSTGPNSVQAVWLADDNIAVQWGDTSPFNYGKFIVHWDPKIDDTDQADINGNHATSGSYQIPVKTDEPYRIVIEGCDVDAGGHSTCRQGWSNPIFLKPDRAIYCDGYAKDAINANRKKPVCVASGPRWQSSTTNHVKWCMTAPYADSHSERKARWDAVNAGCPTPICSGPYGCGTSGPGALHRSR